MLVYSPIVCPLPKGISSNEQENDQGNRNFHSREAAISNFRKLMQRSKGLTLLQYKNDLTFVLVGLQYNLSVRKGVCYMNSPKPYF
jgi:hypothetical protein